MKKIDVAAYLNDKNLRPVQHIKCCLEKTSQLRGKHVQLFVSFQKPHNPVSTDTLARWIKIVMNKAGIYTETYVAYSTGAASTSAAHRNNINTNKILAAAGWHNENSFSKFYNKTIVLKQNYGQDLLSAIISHV